MPFTGKWELESRATSWSMRRLAVGDSCCSHFMGGCQACASFIFLARVPPPHTHQSDHTGKNRNLQITIGKIWLGQFWYTKSGAGVPDLRPKF